MPTQSKPRPTGAAAVRERSQYLEQLPTPQRRSLRREAEPRACRAVRRKTSPAGKPRAESRSLGALVERPRFLRRPSRERGQVPTTDGGTQRRILSPGQGLCAQDRKSVV